ncbi:hypothetical protein [Sorangium sp. So ce1335]|uniref:hypothetical protein n=1 Tax=Sorangium sp. So ce1335 TaxID=3133335 RepID=UPI003F5FFAE1
MGDEVRIVEVARLMGNVEEAVYAMAQDAELPCIKVHGQWRVDLYDFDTRPASQVAGSAGSNESTRKAKEPGGRR